MNKHLQIILVSSVGLIAISVFYFFVIRPIQKDQAVKKCIETADRGLEDATARFERAVVEQKASEEEKRQGIIRATVSYTKIKDDCQKKY